MLTLVFLLVALVVIVKVAELVPAATVTLDGTFARVELLLASVTTVPLAGAAFVRVTIPLEFTPPTAVDGLSVSDASTAGVGGLTVSVADFVTPP